MKLTSIRIFDEAAVFKLLYIIDLAPASAQKSAARNPIGIPGGVRFTCVPAAELRLHPAAAGKRPPTAPSFRSGRPNCSP